MEFTELEQRIRGGENLHTEFKEWPIASASLYYDETVLQRTAIDDINIQAVEQFFLEAQGYQWEQLGLPLERILVNWKLAQFIGAELHLTVAGALFFAKQPQHFLPHAYITALRIPGTTIDTDPSDRKQLTGPLRTILEDALRFLNIHLPTPHKIQGMEPEVKLELPPEALRERLVNACAHRDYTSPSPIRLLIYDDRVEIRSPGHLPNSVTLEALPLGIHVLRNPIIYNVFFTDGAGDGCRQRHSAHYCVGAQIYESVASVEGRRE